MKGKYELEISNRRMMFHLEIERSVTVIKGNSGTGKTTLIRMLLGYLEQGKRSGIRVKTKENVAFSVFTQLTRWDYEFEQLHETIIFIDESVDYIYTKAFQTAFMHSDNYLVIISRSGKFNHLPYAIDGIYEFRTSKQQDMALTKMYRYYKTEHVIQDTELLITEDANAGRQMMENIYDCTVCSAHGNSSVPKTMLAHMTESKSMNVLVDGAAYGGYIAKTLDIAALHGNTCIYAPESFEYLLLNTNMYQRYLNDELERTWDFCDSKEHLTWEQYYIELLNQMSFEHYGFNYSKSRLNEQFENDILKNEIKEQLHYVIQQDKEAK